ncbi:MAG: hypothetical protein QM398_07250 [Thermoproteota archaeon]|nr:hypothetical protein [Thermoproteota archaeon]
MNLREFLVKDCQNNKQITSCEQCLYEQECKQIHINLIIKAVTEWVSGKLVAGSEKANPHNDVILKLLHELDYQQEKEKQK